ncbi:hypothetical protein [uncultured Deinococcus sp.]|uniref:hypothetical protein n=1 Tax=uncultured Deinococcus sp. TaxID=158789 RepID=UPI0025EA7887|nr:hypothetical protein [uncultured Deinococcus sp.]
MTGFPLGGAVAIVGSRHGSPYGVAAFAQFVICGGGQVITGCAPGVDHAAAAAAGAAMQAAHAHPASLQIVRAQGGQAWALARRTHDVVRRAVCVAIFPPAGGVLGPGSALALRLAQARGLAVFVAGPHAPAPDWQAFKVGSVSGWLWPAVVRLF